MSEIDKQLVKKIEGFNLSFVTFFEGVKRKNNLLNAHNFSRALAERTRKWGKNEKRKDILDLIEYGLKKRIYPFLITYHLPEIFRTGTLILLGDTNFRRLEDGLERLSVDKPLTKLHVEYWFHPYQIFDYTRLAESWLWERNQNISEKLEWNPFLLTPPIQTIIPLLYSLEYFLLPFVMYPEYEQFINNLDFVKERAKLMGYNYDYILKIRRQIVGYGESRLGFRRDLLKLIEHADHNKVKQNLKYQDLLGFELLEIAEILRLIETILSGKRALLRDEIFDGRKGKWKLNIYGKRPSKKDRTVLLDLLARFGLNPVYLMTIYTEGTSDIDFIVTFLRELDFVDLTTNMTFESLGGTDNRVTKHKLVSHLKESLVLEITDPSENQDHVFVHSKVRCAILFFDPENLFRPSKIQNTIKWIRNQLETYFTYLYVKNTDVIDLLDHTLKIFIMKEPLEFNFLDDDEIVTILQILNKKKKVDINSIRIANIRQSHSPANQLENYIQSLGLDHPSFKNDFAKTSGKLLAIKLKQIQQQDKTFQGKYPMRQTRLINFYQLLCTTLNDVEKARLIGKR